MYFMGPAVQKCDCTCLRFAVTKIGISVIPLYRTTRALVYEGFDSFYLAAMSRSQNYGEVRI